MIDTELLQSILDVTFTDIFPIVLPLLFLFMLFLFTDNLVEIIYKAVGTTRARGKR